MRQAKTSFEPPATLLLTVFLLLFFSGICAVGQENTETETITAASLEERAQKILATKEAISKERASWIEQKPLFESLIPLREKEISEIDEFTEAAKVRIEEVSKKRSSLENEESARKTWRSAFARDVATLESSIREVIPLLPTPVKEKVGDSIARLEIESTDEIPLQERFRDILSVLSAARDFDSRLTIDSEIREFGGERFQLDVLYLGLDHAWFVDESGKVAGKGVPTATGWVWTEDNSIASKVRSAIAVNQKEAPPAMVSLPFASKTAKPSASE